MNCFISRPEGFIVNELPGSYGLGQCTHFTLTKQGWNTIDAVKAVAKALGVDFSRLNYSGLKDKNAITSQRVSAWRVPKFHLERVNIDGIKLSDFVEGLERITLGSHLGNEFIIKLSGASLSDLRKPFNVPNLFGFQRFGGNEVFGKLLIARDWERLAGLLINESPVRSFLKRRPGDFLNAVRQVDKRVRVLWVNALQALEWNDSVDLSKEFMNLPSYPVINEMPELGSFPGSPRRTVMQVTDYSASDDVILKFKLSKGSYATVLINFVLGRGLLEVI